MSSHTESPRRVGSQPCSTSKTRNLAILRTSLQKRRRQVTVRAPPGGVPAAFRSGPGETPATLSVGAFWLVVVLDMANRRRHPGGAPVTSGENFTVLAAFRPRSGRTPGEVLAPSGPTPTVYNRGVASARRRQVTGWPPSDPVPVPPWRRSGEFDPRSRSGQCLAAPRRRPGPVPVPSGQTWSRSGRVLAFAWLVLIPSGQGWR